jgi:hypothetical protein
MLASVGHALHTARVNNGHSRPPEQCPLLHAESGRWLSRRTELTRSQIEFMERRCLVPPEADLSTLRRLNPATTPSLPTRLTSAIGAFLMTYCAEGPAIQANKLVKSASCSQDGVHELLSRAPSANEAAGITFSLMLPPPCDGSQDARPLDLPAMQVTDDGA